MKTLKKGNDFKRVKDSNMEDLKKIDDMIALGWEYSNKKDWKEWRGQNKNEEKEKKKKTKRGKK